MIFEVVSMDGSGTAHSQDDQLPGKRDWDGNDAGNGRDGGLPLKTERIFIRREDGSPGSSRI